MILSRPLAVFAAAASLAACGSFDYDPVVFTVEEDRLVAVGVVDRSTIAAFAEAAAANPDVDVLELRNVGGSADDEANLELSRMVRAAGFATVVPSNGLVASGGTDLFLAGVERVLEEGACVGVHSWGFPDLQGRDLPRSDPEHAPYLAYYRAVSVPEAFYWFTLESASVEDIHWMTGEEAERFAMTTTSPPPLGPGAACDER